MQKISSEQTPRLCAPDFVNRACYEVDEVDCKLLVSKTIENCIDHFKVETSMTHDFYDRLRGILETCVGAELTYKLKDEYKELATPTCSTAQKNLIEQAQ